MSKEWKDIKAVYGYVPARFNDMPFEYRSITADSETLTRIQDILIQKKRLRENYVRELKHLNEKIKIFKHSLDENYKPLTEQQ